MKKTRFNTLATLTAVSATMTIATAARAQDVRVQIDREPVTFAGQPPITDARGRVLVPLRGVLERLGAFVRYDAQAKTVTALRGETNIVLPVNGRTALVGDKAVTLDTPAQIVNGATLVPLRFVAEALGARVVFDSPTRTVAITSGDAARSTLPPPVAARTETQLRGAVTAVYADAAPRRVVLRVPGEKVDRTIPLNPRAPIVVQRANGASVPITLERVRVGDMVVVRQTGQGAAGRVDVVARAASTAQAYKSPAKPKPQPASVVFKGEFLNATKADNGAYILKMTDGNLIEVPGDVPIRYGRENVKIDDLRSGDNLTISVDPKTRRGTRVVIAVDK